MPNESSRSSFQKVLINVAFITGSNLIGRVLNLGLHAALARGFGPEGLGGYATAVALSTYFIFGVDFGVSPRLVREGAVSPDELEDEFANGLALKLAMAALALVFLFGLSFVLPYEAWVVELCLLLSLASIVRSFAYLSESVCRARERLDFEGASRLTNTAVFVGGSLFMLHLGYPVVAIGWASLIAAFVHLALSTFLASRFIRIGLHLPPKWSLVGAALPYATTTLSLLAFAQIDVLIISFIEDAEFVGRYSAISRLLLIAGTLGSLFSSAVLPTASRIFATASRERFDAIINGALRVVLSVGFAAGLGTAVLARWIIELIYGEAFVDLYPMLQLGALFLVFQFGTSILAMVLTSSGRQGDRARSVLVGLFSTIVLVFTLVPYFGIAGAVSAMIMSELILLLCFAFALSQYLDWFGLFRTLGCLILSAGCALAAYAQLRTADDLSGILLSAIVPGLVYLGLVFATGEGSRSIKFVLGLRRAQPVEAGESNHT